MTTPIDTTRLRALAEAVRDARSALSTAFDAATEAYRAWKKAPRGHKGARRMLYNAAVDSEMRASNALQKATETLGDDEATILSLLDENARLRASAEEAYPRALQAAADLVLDCAARWRATEESVEMHEIGDSVEAVADRILELTEEEIDIIASAHESQAAFGRAVAAVPLATDAPEDLRSWCWRTDVETPIAHGPCGSREEAIAEARREGYARVLVGRCTDPWSVVGLPDAEEMRDRIADLLDEHIEDGGNDTTTGPEPEATEALRAWCRKYVHTGLKWIGANEEWVTTDATEEGGTR